MAVERRRRRWPWILLGGLAVAVGVRLALDPLATWRTRVGLAEIAGFRSRFDDVAVGLFPPRYELLGLQMRIAPVREDDRPFFAADRIVVTPDWRDLLRLQVNLSARVERPRVAVLGAPRLRRAEEQVAPRQPFPVHVDRLEIVDGEVRYVDVAARGDPELRVHDLDAVAEDFATRKELAGDRPAKVRGDAAVAGSGRMAFAVSVQPWAARPTFSGRLLVRDLDLRELQAFAAARGDVTLHGILDLFAEFRARDGELAGGVKPRVRDPDVARTREGIVPRVKEGLGDLAVELLDSDRPGEDIVATVIPIRGRVDAPRAQLVPAIFGVVRNAFVAGIRGGFAHLPPPTSETQEGVLEQFRRLLSEDEPPVRAQPEPDRPRRDADRPARRRPEPPRR